MEYLFLYGGLVYFIVGKEETLELLKIKIRIIVTYGCTPIAVVWCIIYKSL